MSNYENHEKNVSESLALYDTLLRNREGLLVARKQSTHGFSESEILKMAEAIAANAHRIKKDGFSVESPDAARETIKFHFDSLQAGEIGALWLNTKHDLIKADVLLDVDRDNLGVIVKHALGCNAAACILVSTSGGLDSPSSEVKALTDLAKEKMLLVDVRILDHFIIGNRKKLSSMVENGWM